jgi:hypothetical protein
MILLSAVRGLALIGALVLPDVGRPVAEDGLVDLAKVLAGGRKQDSGQLLAALGGGYISGQHALQGAVQFQIDFRPLEGEDTAWDVYLWLNDEGWVYMGEAVLNYAGDIILDGANGDGWASFSCVHDGGWTWTAYSMGEKIGSGTMS